MDPTITPEQAHETDAAFVDVRTNDEWAGGHLPNAEHVPLDLLQSHADRLRHTDRPVVFYCRTGERSAMAAEAFRGAGIEAASLAGGLEAWEAEGLPIERE